MDWFAVRYVLSFDRKPNGVNVYEERIVGFQAASGPEAIERAIAESEEYAASFARPVRVHDHFEAYLQDGEDLIDGYELWSQLFESRLGLDEFFEARYAAFQYRPPPQIARPPG